jgi:hypothetical protein
MRGKLHSLLFFPFLLTSILVYLSPSLPVLAQSTYLDSKVEYTFGGPVAFIIKLETKSPVEEILVFLRSHGENQTFIGEAEPSGSGEFQYLHDASLQPLRAFAHVEYWFQVNLKDGSQETSPVYSFFYQDNRFVWQKLSRAPYHVHWYEGDVSFGQGILDIAHEGQKKAKSLLPLPVPDDVNIYVYASSEELQATRRLLRQEGVAGHADVDLGLIVVSLPNLPDRRLEAERTVPHEVMHIMLYQAIGQGYEHLPTWLNEGLASINELYPNPDFQISLESAIKNSTLIPLNQLCNGFPIEISGFILSYAESAYFTRYLYRTFGSEKIYDLAATYARGFDCEQGFEQVMGISLSDAEKQWIADSFGPLAASGVDLQPSNLWPWLILLFVVVAVPMLAALPGLMRPKGDKRMGVNEAAGD